jgi:hypothetical protein
MLQTVSWNVENFVKINEMIKHTGLINKLIKTDLIFLQEYFVISLFIFRFFYF